MSDSMLLYFSATSLGSVSFIRITEDTKAAKEITPTARQGNRNGLHQLASHVFAESRQYSQSRATALL